MLQAPLDGGGDEGTLEIRLGKAGVFVEGLSEWPVANSDDVNHLLTRGNHTRCGAVEWCVTRADVAERAVAVGHVVD